MKGEMLNLAEERQGSAETQKNSYFMSYQEITISSMMHPKAGSREGLWKKVGPD